MKNSKRYEHSILTVTQTIASHVSGSCQDLSKAELDVLAEWLAERVNSGWIESSPKTHDTYDSIVRALAKSALAMWGHP